MLRQWIFRLFIGCCFAIPAGLFTVVAAQASPTAQGVPADDCQSCHRGIVQRWETGGHGMAMQDPEFLTAWEAQGEPGACLTCHTTGYDPLTGEYESEGVDCLVCHGPVPSTHPDQIMPTDYSSRLCGSCHIDTYDEWLDSTHGQENLACYNCHNVHSTALKKDSAQAVCEMCHSDEVHVFEDTQHGQEGVLCIDCHLEVSESTMGEGHGERKHTLMATIGTCNECHGEDLHRATMMADTDSVTMADMADMADNMAEFQPEVEEAEISAEPDPVNPMGFAVVAALAGMAAGIVLAPWLENWYRGRVINN